MRSRNIQADIFDCLTDGKFHTTNEIAQKVEASQITVKRHLQSLSYRFNIETFRGGIDHGGIRLRIEDKINMNYLNVHDLQLIKGRLESLQDSNPNIKNFLHSLNSLIEKKGEQKYGKEFEK